MKRIVALIAAVLALSGCAAAEKEDRADALQKQYAEMSGCKARVYAGVVREESTDVYLLDVERTGEETRVTVVEPEEITGISAVISGDNTLKLAFDGMVLDAGSVNPGVSAVNGVSILLRAAAEGYVVERSTERFEGGNGALRLCFETDIEGETLLVTAYFDSDNTPLYAEIGQDGAILEYLEFTSFEFGDILQESEE